MTSRIVALGGGHGLFATLRALRNLELEPTAIVGVADDGGSSGRLRSEFGSLPPGDLRMALAALCPDDRWGELLQYRFPGTGALGGHSLGNLLISAAWQQSGDPVRGLAAVAGLLGIRGAVLPASTEPLTIAAQVRLMDGALTEVRGQEDVAITPGHVERVFLTPGEPVACREAVEAVAGADAVVMGPGSWFTSVIPHLLIPRLCTAVQETGAKRVLVVNVQPRIDHETRGIAVHDQVRILHRYAPHLTFDAIVADPEHVESRAALDAAADGFGAHVIYAAVHSADQPGTHDPRALGEALRRAF